MNTDGQITMRKNNINDVRSSIKNEQHPSKVVKKIGVMSKSRSSTNNTHPQVKKKDIMMSIGQLGINNTHLRSKKQPNQSGVQVTCMN